MKKVIVLSVSLIFIAIAFTALAACNYSRDKSTAKDQDNQKKDQTTPVEMVKTSAQGTQTAQGSWVVPDAYKNKKNPVKANAESKDNGKSLFMKHCASCHGKTGMGDGPRSSTLKTSAGNFKAAAFQGQPDGSLFYKISEGKGEMPSYKKKLSENDIWDVVNFTRSLK